MIICQHEDCDNVAAISSPKWGATCWKHYRDGCTCGEDRDDPLCIVHGDPRDTNVADAKANLEKY